MPDPAALAPWFTPTLLVALFAWLKRDLGAVEARLAKRIDAVDAGLRREITAIETRLTARIDRLEDRLTGVESRLAGVEGRLADVGERTARTEGRLEHLPFRPRAARRLIPPARGSALRAPWS